MEITKQPASLSVFASLCLDFGWLLFNQLVVFKSFSSHATCYANPFRVHTLHIIMNYNLKLKFDMHEECCCQISIRLIALKYCIFRFWYPDPVAPSIPFTLNAILPLHKFIATIRKHLTFTLSNTHNYYPMKYSIN